MDSGRRQFMVASAVALAAGLRGPCAWADGTLAPAATDVPLALVAAKLAGAGPTISYDGTAAGPVIRIRKGMALAVSLTNRLAEPTSLQWHGMRAANAVDGDLPLVGRAVAPGETVQMRVEPPDSGLTWFHPAALPGSADQTAAGLRGVLIVEEAAAPVCDCDLVVTVGGSADSPSVNGGAAPLRDTLVSGGRLRLRVLNASTSRIMVLGIEGARPKVIAIDGQPSDLFEPVRDAVPVGPGARFEFLMDAPRDEDDQIRLFLRGAGLSEASGAADTLLAELTAKGAPRDPLPPIVPLPRNPLLPPAIPLERSVRANCIIETVPSGAARWRINGVAALDPAPRPLLAVPRGGTVTLRFDNRSHVPAPIRVHGHVVRLLHAKDDGWEPYWRDSVILPPASTTHVAFVAENPGRWLLESAMFDQAAFGLRSWFAVT